MHRRDFPYKVGMKFKRYYRPYSGDMCYLGEHEIILIGREYVHMKPTGRLWATEPRMSFEAFISHVENKTIKIQFDWFDKHKERMLSETGG